MNAIPPLRLLRLAAKLAACAAFLPAMAQQGVPADLSARVRDLVAAQDFALGAEIEVSVGEPDARLSLAACRRYEPFIPTGARLWGRASLGVRCLEGASWTAYVPVQIRVFGPGLVASRPLARGGVVSSGDVQVDRVEWTRWPAGVLAVAPDQVEGRVLTRGVQPGEPIRRDMVREAPVFRPGEPIRIVYAGRGFSVNAEGKAITAGFDGLTAQGALTGGRIVTGIVRSGGVLEIR